MRFMVSYFRVTSQRTYPGRIEIEASRAPLQWSDIEALEAYILSTYVRDPADEPVDFNTRIIVSDFKHLLDVVPEKFGPFTITEQVLPDAEQPAAVDQWLGG